MSHIPFLGALDMPDRAPERDAIIVEDCARDNIVPELCHSQCGTKYKRLDIMFAEYKKSI